MNLAATKATAYAWLRAKLVTANVTGGRVDFETVPVGSVTYPRTIIALLGIGAERGNGTIHMYDRYLARISVVSKDVSPDTTQSDQQAVYTALDGQAGTVAETSGAVLSCIKTLDLPPRPQRDGLTIYYYPGHEFELVVQ